MLVTRIGKTQNLQDDIISTTYLLYFTMFSRFRCMFHGQNENEKHVIRLLFFLVSRIVLSSSQQSSILSVTIAFVALLIESGTAHAIRFSRMSYDDSLLRAWFCCWLSCVCFLCESIKIRSYFYFICKPLSKLSLPKCSYSMIKWLSWIFRETEYKSTTTEKYVNGRSSIFIVKWQRTL